MGNTVSSYDFVPSEFSFFTGLNGNGLYLDKYFVLLFRIDPRPQSPLRTFGRL